MTDYVKEANPTDNLMKPDPHPTPWGYDVLASVFHRAVARAASGKGRRHQTKPGEFFTNQRIMRSARQFGIGSMLAQIAKKVEEVPKIKGTSRKQDELLDIMVYAAAAWLALEEMKPKK